MDYDHDKAMAVLDGLRREREAAPLGVPSTTILEIETIARAAVERVGEVTKLWREAEDLLHTSVSTEASAYAQHVHSLQDHFDAEVVRRREVDARAEDAERALSEAREELETERSRANEAEAQRDEWHGHLQATEAQRDEARAERDALMVLFDAARAGKLVSEWRERDGTWTRWTVGPNPWCVASVSPAGIVNVRDTRKPKFRGTRDDADAWLRKHYKWVLMTEEDASRFPGSSHG